MAQNSRVGEHESRRILAADSARRETSATQLKALIYEQARDHVEKTYDGALRALILTGSLARDEATFRAGIECWRLLGDAEFLLIFCEWAVLPDAASLDRVRQGIEDDLLRLGLECEVALSAAYPGYLRKMSPHIYGYELRICGHVVLGDTQILSLIPRFSASDIPWEDAWRLLCNRMIEQLEMASELLNGTQTLSRDVHYRTVKLYLDMATSFLLFVGAYEPTYRGRAEKLRVLAETTAREDQYPFPVRSFSERVTMCTGVKLLGTDQGERSGSAAESGPGLAFWEEAVAYAEQLWRWELARLTGLGNDISNRALWQAWMRHQLFRHRLRGWLSLLRRHGWPRNWREWLRWGYLSWQASPRYWIYAAASELFFRLPFLLRLGNQRTVGDVDWNELLGWLPVMKASDHSDALAAWEPLASEIVWNYHQFLEKTRA